MAITFALLSLLCGGVNDAVFKAWRNRRGTLGPFFTLAGAVVTAVFILRGLLRGSLAFDGTTLVWGLLAGSFSAGANYLLVWAMAETEAGLAATIYRLNLILVAVLSFLVLGESFGPMKILALAVATAAVILFSRSPGTGRKTAGLFLLALLGASALRAGMGLTYKLASLRSVNEDCFLALGGLCWLAFGAVTLLAVRRQTKGPKAIPFLPVVSGLLISGIILFLKLAVNLGDAGVVVTIAQFSFLITLPISIRFFGEKLTGPKLVAFALAILAILLLSLS